MGTNAKRPNEASFSFIFTDSDDEKICVAGTLDEESQRMYVYRFSRIGSKALCANPRPDMVSTVGSMQGPCKPVAGN
jgi:hypothetical protein